MTWLKKRPTPETDAIAAYWDALVDQQPAVPVPPAGLPSSHGALIRQLHAEEALGSLPSYQDELLQRLLASYEETPTMTAMTTAASLPQPQISPPIRTGRRDSAPVSRRRTQTPPQRTGWTLRPAVAIALVILLVLASIGGGVWFTNMNTGQDDPNRLMAPVVATPSADASPDVPMYRANPERTGVMPGPGINGQPIELWRVEFDGSLTAVPSLVNGVLYLGAGDGGIRAVDAATGETVWTFAGSSPISSTPAIHNGVVIAGSEDGTLYALDTTDGSEIWTFPGARAQASVAIVDGTVYTGSGNGFLYALEVDTGEEIWSAPLNAEASRSPAVSDGVVYQGSADGVLHTFDAETGEPGWTLNLAGDGTISTTIVTDGIVYEGTFEGQENHFFALDTASGKEIWRFDSESGVGFYSAAADGEVLYTVTGEGVIYSIDTATGQPRWQAETGDQFAYPPALVGDTLYVSGGNGVVYALDAATGTERWRFNVDGAANGGLIVVGGVAYLGTSFGYLYAIGGNAESDAATPGSSATPGATPVGPTGKLASSPEASADLAELVWHSPGGDVEFAQPWDLTIAPDGDIWLADGEHHQFQIFSPEGEWLESWGGDGVGSDDGQFNFTRPNSENDASSAVAFAPDGSFYVADMGNQRIQHFGDDRQFLNAWGEFGPGDGQFLSPNDLQVDSQGNVFVIDAIRGDIQKFTADGTFLLGFSGEGATPGQLDFSMLTLSIDADDHLWIPRGPLMTLDEYDTDGSLVARHDVAGAVEFATGTAFDGSGRIYVVDPVGARVVVFDSSLAVIGQWGERGDGPGQFQQPQAIAIDGEGNAYVSDYATGLHAFGLALPPTPGATPVAAQDVAVDLAWQSAGGPDPLLSPSGLAFDPDGNLWVTDTGNHRFQIFSPNGEYLETWGVAGDGDGELNFYRSPNNPGEAVGDIAFAPDGSFYVTNAGSKRIQHFAADRTFIGAWGSLGTENGQFLDPFGVAVAPDGNVYVIDDERGDIQVFDPEGTYLLTIGEPGSESGQLDPGVLAIDADGNVWVADWGNNRIQQFAADGTFIMTFGEFGPEEGQFINPEDLVVDQDGHVYVTDPNGGRVQVFTAEGTFLLAWSETNDGEGV